MPHHEAQPVAEARRVEVRKMAMGRAARATMAPVMMRAGMGMMRDAASMFLSCTGELQLSDAQVTKLAAIARRAESRQKAMRSRMDSALVRGKTEAMGDGNGEEMMFVRMRMAMPSDADRKAQHEDDREAFSIVTPDQLATAWELMSMHRRDH